jgi:hypothetical protein
METKSEFELPPGMNEVVIRNTAPNGDVLVLTIHCLYVRPGVDHASMVVTEDGVFSHLPLPDRFEPLRKQNAELRISGRLMAREQDEETHVWESIPHQPGQQRAAIRYMSTEREQTGSMKKVKKAA